MDPLDSCSFFPINIRLNASYVSLLKYTQDMCDYVIIMALQGPYSSNVVIAHIDGMLPILTFESKINHVYISIICIFPQVAFWTHCVNYHNL